MQSSKQTNKAQNMTFFGGGNEIFVDNGLFMCTCLTTQRDGGVET